MRVHIHTRHLRSEDSVVTPDASVGIKAKFDRVHGDAIHDPRSALDHLVRQLVIIETGAPPVTYTQFPIFLTQAGYETRGEPLRLVGVGSQAKTIIKSLQPFATGDGDKCPLWHLHELDKHRDMVVANAARTGSFRAKDVPLDEFLEFFVSETGMLEDNAVAWQGRLKPSPVPFMDRLATIQIKIEPAYCIAFEQPELVYGQELFTVLNAVSHRAFDIVAELEPFPLRRRSVKPA
jgi:hypothetical protein